MSSYNCLYPEPVEMDGPGLEWGPVQWANEGTFADADHPQSAENERRFYTIAVRRGKTSDSSVASIGVLGVTSDLEYGYESRFQATLEDGEWTLADRDKIPPSICKRPPRDSTIPTGRKGKFRRVLERAHGLKDDPADAGFEATSELRADGGTSEADLVDRAVREVTTLIDAGDSKRVAINYVVNEYELKHRCDDVHGRVQDRHEQVVLTDGGQRSSGTYRAECPGCGDDTTFSESGTFGLLSCDSCTYAPRASVRWEIRSQDTDTEPITDGGHNPDDLVVLECEPCDYQTVVARGAMSITSCPDCKGDLEIDNSRVAHNCSGTTANHVIVEANERCPFCQTIQRAVVADGGRDAFLSGDAHWCDVCSTPFDTLGELIRHDCQDQQLVADGGRSEHRARCDDCSWSYRDTDLVDVSDEMERHARKEMHDVDFERAVATDGGQCVDGTERTNSYECEKMVGQHVKSIEDVNDLTRAVNRVLNDIRAGGPEDIRVVIATEDRTHGPGTDLPVEKSENSTGTEGGDRR
ncbi:hypothetical protein [Halostagnicola sp. A-GB9-2]|uniref:hypothetical protein n=1 Tax=Halostagnicola sp. A-GB9-2 TaxID=3048066 RepID=UPI0024C066FC|nr:hypothetical protein [Halostagnicola sp. A-GB9-2]MDJ1433550.1 hypothetical protein [Halostagnicola sp. A-GB9-2]